MRQRHLLIAALAIAAVGCSKDESATTPNASSSFDSRAINFTSNTSRASVVDLATLETNGTDFKVFATVDSKTTEWYKDAKNDAIDGTDNYLYSNNSWGWTTSAPSWPTETTDYPMEFYAIYPSTTPTSGGAGALASTITIADTAAEQVDIMSAQSTADTRPSDGQLPLCFKHMLSRIDFGVVAGDDVAVELQRITMGNVGNSRTYDMQNQIWSATQPSEFVSDYSYTELDGDDKFNTTGNDDTEQAATSVAGSDDYLMLMPQDGDKPWNPALLKAGTETLADMTGSYIEVIYRYEAVLDKNDVGYDSYTKHPDYQADPNNEKYDKYENGGTVGPTALYVRVAFPVDVKWEMGKAYTYNIGLGTTKSSNGYLLDGVYYDKNGDPTEFPIDIKDIVPGDPITSDKIDFIVTICKPWETVTQSVE